MLPGKRGGKLRSSGKGGSEQAIGQRAGIVTRRAD